MSVNCSRCNRKLLVPSWKYCEECGKIVEKERNATMKKKGRPMQASTERRLRCYAYGMPIQEVCSLFNIIPSTLKRQIEQHADKVRQYEKEYETSFGHK